MEMTDDERKEYEAWKASKSNITKIEVKPEVVPDLPKKEKKPRSEAQIEATRRMREGLAKRRADGQDTKREHSEAFQKTMSIAQEKADKIKEVLPMAKVVVKSRVGRPKGTKNAPTDPTPAQSESDEEEERPVISKVKKPIPSRPIEIRRVSNIQDYLDRLNGR
jgi:hypothetical protein